MHRIRKCEWGQVKENVDELCKRNENEAGNELKMYCVYGSTREGGGGGRIRIVRLIYLLFLLIEVPSITVCKQCRIT